MSLIIALGANIGEPIIQLQKAREELSLHLEFIAASRIYQSRAIEYENQPDFFNQVLEFQIPLLSPEETLNLCLDIEKKMGRMREIRKGPRTIDIDMIFWDLQSIQTKQLTIPHPEWANRSFVVLPLQELPYFHIIKTKYIINNHLLNTAQPI